VSITWAEISEPTDTNVTLSLSLPIYIYIYMCVYTIYRSFCFVYVVVFLIVSFSLSLYCKVQQKLFCFFGVVKSSGLLYMIRVFQAMVGIAAG
jgi:hypothetical protein